MSIPIDKPGGNNKGQKPPPVEPHAIFSVTITLMSDGTPRVDYIKNKEWQCIALMGKGIETLAAHMITQNRGEKPMIEVPNLILPPNLRGE